MRRPLLAVAGLLACAGPQKQKPAAALVQAAVVAPEGFEPQANELRTGYDLAHDGKADVWKYTSRDAAGKELLLRKEKDLNGDGKVDTWEKYAPDGTLDRAVYDLDFDGRPDETLFYEKDQLVKKEVASGLGGVPRSWSFYEKGKLVRKERDTNGDGRVDDWEYWQNGEVDRVGVDENGDGRVDRWEARKTAEPAAERNPAPAPPPVQK